MPPTFADIVKNQDIRSTIVLDIGRKRKKKKGKLLINDNLHILCMSQESGLVTIRMEAPKYGQTEMRAKLQFRRGSYQAAVSPQEIIS